MRMVSLKRARLRKWHAAPVTWHSSSSARKACAVRKEAAVTAMVVCVRVPVAKTSPAAHLLVRMVRAPRVSAVLTEKAVRVPKVSAARMAKAVAVPACVRVA